LVAIAAALVIGAFALRTNPSEEVEGRFGTVEALLDEFSNPSEPEFTSLGVSMLVLAGAAALGAALLLLRLYRPR
jgi:hypothetical protein